MSIFELRFVDDPPVGLPDFAAGYGPVAAAGARSTISIMYHRSTRIRAGYARPRRSAAARLTVLRGVGPPPEKWSDLNYVF
jgi:hypothetical protein